MIHYGKKYHFVFIFNTNPPPPTVSAVVILSKCLIYTRKLAVKGFWVSSILT